MRFDLSRTLVCVLVSALPGLLAAQEIPRPAPAWGTASYSVRTIHGTSFRPIQSDTTYSQNAVTTHLFRTGGQLYFDYALSDLPAGALLTGIELEYCDTNPAASVNAGVHSRSAAGVNDIVGPTLDSGDAAIPGCGFLGSVSNLELPVKSSTISRSRTGFGSRWKGPTIRQASAPCACTTASRSARRPPTATFNDVPTTHPFFQFVEALSRSGITAGCGSGNFCPDAPLTRKQMAAFLSIALGLHFSY